MKPRNHAWAQLVKSDTFYMWGCPKERALQPRLGLLEDEEGEAAAEDELTDLERQVWLKFNIVMYSCIVLLVLLV